MWSEIVIQISTRLHALGFFGICFVINRFFSSLDHQQGSLIRAERKAQLIRFLKSGPRTINGPKPSAIVFRVFEDVFGRKHLSWKCLVRSLLVSVFFVASLTYTLIYTSGNGRIDLRLDSDTWIADGFLLVFFTLIPDYLSLWKGRALLHRMSQTASHGRILILVLIDFVSSLVICATSAVVWFLPVSYINVILIEHQVPPDAPLLTIAGAMLSHSLYLYTYTAWQAIEFLILQRKFPDAGELFFFQTALTLSTLFTSAWTIVVGISVFILRVFVSAGYAFSWVPWLFAVEERPFQALGIVVILLLYQVSEVLTL